MTDQPTRKRRSPRVTRQLAALREARAVDLRLLGSTYTQIAASLLPCSEHRPAGDPLCPVCERMYHDASGAKKAVERVLAREYAAGAEAREQLSQQHLGQIDLLLRAAMRAAVGGDWEACRAATRLLDRRARHLGLDAPRRHVLTTELDEEIAALMIELQAQQAQGAPAVQP